MWHRRRGWQGWLCHTLYTAASLPAWCWLGVCSEDLWGPHTQGSCPCWTAPRNGSSHMFPSTQCNMDTCKTLDVSDDWERAALLWKVFTNKKLPVLNTWELCVCLPGLVLGEASYSEVLEVLGFHIHYRTVHNGQRVAEKSSKYTWSIYITWKALIDIFLKSRNEC